MNNNSKWEDLIAEDLNVEEQVTIAGGAGIQDFLVLQSLLGSSNGGGGLNLGNLLVLEALQDPNAGGSGGLLSGLFGSATPAD
ncbi:hypothetical protein [Mastigocoleus sp. MO_188.B34]|uniref:hypothetical protein n=1 Tax=Mastigocoleus sp. MO_188.B34 TaxID=3036635 RepID=UPI00262A7573|nr:hypothetical protein [Mastigocoleus sp. MO_188.B34]MDJ0694264.1 hypothetical protein [Mastigocoleus sp. MO_188.B34]